MHVETTYIDGLPGPVVDVDIADDGRVLILAGDESARTIWLDGRAIELGPSYLPTHVRFVGTDYFLTAGKAPNTGGLTLHAFEQPGIWTVNTGGDIIDLNVVGQWVVMGFGDINDLGFLAIPLTGHSKVFYRQAFGMNAVSVGDCHCLCRLDDGQVALFGCLRALGFPRSSQSLLSYWDPHQEIQRVAPAPESLTGAHALSINGPMAYFFAPFQDEGREPASIVERRFRAVFSWRIGTEVVERVGEFQAATTRVRGLPGGRFLTFEDDSYSILTI